MRQYGDDADIDNAYIDWLYEKFSIGNNHMLVPKLEDADLFQTFLEEQNAR